MKKFKVIAIDGPSGSGKSTTARLLATKLGYTYLDTGAMYRCVTLAALEQEIDLRDEDKVTEIAGSIRLAISPSENGDRILLDDRDVTIDIRSPKVDANVSLVSSYRGVRERMVSIQREFAERGNVVAEGRDIGTVVFPDADLKIYLVADLETRATRRCRQLESYGMQSTIEDQAAALASRDLFDSGRANSPLRQADDAILLDTSGMSINEQVGKALDLAFEKLLLQ